MTHEENSRVLTFSDSLFEKMAANEESVAVFKVGSSFEPVTLVLKDENSFELHKKQFPDARMVGKASYHDIDRGYVASDLLENGYTNYEEISKYVQERQNKSFILEVMPGFIGRLFNANVQLTEKQHRTAAAQQTRPQLN